MRIPVKTKKRNFDQIEIENIFNMLKLTYR